MKKEKLILIDGNSYCYRAFYAIKELRNSRGQPTNAVYGFTLMLRKLLEKEKPDYLAIAFDLKGPTFRHKQFEDYKIHRKPMPDDLISQMAVIKSLVSAYNIPIFEKQGFEADDILATIARKVSDRNIDVYIITGDKDILQIVDDRVKVCSTHKDELIYDERVVRDRFSGLGPENIVDILGLAGDATDNIPGVAGIGEKTAIELIKQFGSIDNLYRNLDKIESESKRRILSEHQENAKMSRELATVDTSVPIDIDIESMRIKKPDSEMLLSIFRDLEFKNFAKEIAAGYSEINKEAHYKTISDKKGFEIFLKALAWQKEFVLDVESTSEQPMDAELVGISFCWKPGEAYYISLAQSGSRFPSLSLGTGKVHLGAEHPDTQHLGARQGSREGVEITQTLKELKPVLEDERIKKIGQNIKYDKLVLSRYGIDMRGIVFDTMIASYLLNPSKMSHSLDDLAFEHLEHKMVSIDELLGTGKKRITMDKVSVEKVSMYSCEDSDVTLRLKAIFEQGLLKKELDRLFREIELPLIDVLAEMEKNGIKIDVGFLAKISEDMDIELSELIKDIYRIAGTEFNINSPKQLSQILFEKLGLPIVKKTKTGASTDVEVLERLSQLHTLPKGLLRYRELSKLKSTYIDALPELINRDTGRLHTSFNQTVTATGRLSSSNPNLQNIPVKTEEGRKIRKAFIGEKGNLIMSADYSQIELRILAHLSKDPELISAFEKDSDVHTHTASLIFGKDEKDVTPEMRQNAKTVNFGIIYGMSAFGLSKSLDIDTGTAQEFIDSYLERYPRVRLYMEDRIQEARDAGYVTTLFNRRRYIPEIKTGALREQQQAERIAINTPVQGSAADLIKIAMINIYKDMKKKGLKSLMTLQVHDELVFEVTRDELDKMKALVKEEMEGAVKLLVPIKVSVKHGKNWLEMA